MRKRQYIADHFVGDNGQVQVSGHVHMYEFVVVVKGGYWGLCRGVDMV